MIDGGSRTGPTARPFVFINVAMSADGKIDFVADGNGDYARELGLAIDLAGAGMGTRVKRFSMLVDNGVVKTLNFEPEGAKGIQATGAATMISQIGS